MANNLVFPLLFKYLRADHVADFYKRGTVKIGTLYEYRAFERYGPEIGDREEGIKCTFSTDSVNSPSDVESNPVLKRIIINPGGQINICGARFELREKSLDLYIYSMTESFDPHIARNLGYDACIIIEQPELFLSSNEV